MSQRALPPAMTQPMLPLGLRKSASLTKLVGGSLGAGELVGEGVVVLSVPCVTLEVLRPEPLCPRGAS